MMGEVLDMHNDKDFDNDPITFWWIRETSMRGQGKRSGGMVKGGMAARVDFEQRMDVTLSVLRKNIDKITQKNTRINYHDVIMVLTKDEIIDFLKSPRRFTVNIVKNRLSTS